MSVSSFPVFPANWQLDPEPSLDSGLIFLAPSKVVLCTLAGGPSGLVVFLSINPWKESPPKQWSPGLPCAATRWWQRTRPQVPRETGETPARGTCFPHCTCIVSPWFLNIKATENKLMLYLCTMFVAHKNSYNLWSPRTLCPSSHLISKIPRNSKSQCPW